jgi:hypothetical protein
MSKIKKCFGVKKSILTGGLVCYFEPTSKPDHGPGR